MGLCLFAWAILGTIQDEAHFSKITRFYRTTFPTADFKYNWHMGDGPRGGKWQLHIDVPQAVEKEHFHPFQLGFLKQKAQSKEPLERQVAEDLLYLRNP